MNYNRMMEMEDLYIEMTGRHPRYVYTRDVADTGTSYENFLKIATGCYNYGEVIQKKCVTKKEKEDTEPEIAFGSACTIGSTAADKIGERIGASAYGLYKSIQGNCIDGWKDKDVFYQWTLEEMERSNGTKLMRFDVSKPYGPDNCMLSGRPESLIKPISEKHHCDFLKMYKQVAKLHDPDKEFAVEWRDTVSFARWLQLNESNLPDYTTMQWKVATEPFGPDNCKFGSRKVQARTVNPLLEKVKAIGERYKANPAGKWYSLSYSGLLNRQAWPLNDYLQWVIDQYNAGDFAPFLNRLDQSQPYTADNCYFSWRQKNLQKHGMTNTRLYRKYAYFVAKYRRYFEHVEDKPSFEEFMEFALTKKNYQLNFRMKVHLNGDYVTMDDIEFYPDDDDFDDINRICQIYEEIPKDENDFGGLMAFMDWTIRQGYQPWMDFKKVGKGNYSPTTCVWDIFSESGYIASKGRRTLALYNNKS